MYICVSNTKTVTSTDNYQLIDDTNLEWWVLMLQLLGVMRDKVDMYVGMKKWLDR